MNQDMPQNQNGLSKRKQESLRAKAEKHRVAQASALAKSAEIRAVAEKLEPKKRAKLIRRAEKFEIKANAKKVRAKQLDERAEGKINDKEWKRISKSRRNHWVYDRISAVVSRFRSKNPLREEGMSFEREDKKFENRGRIFLGGTKAMNRFVDEQGRDWLCKEAVTCLGTAKPMGALVTEAASRLQEVINPETAVRAFTYRDEKGNVCGSLQERLEMPENPFDLFKWQTDTSQPLPAGITSQILREHVTDWLLCNFDTKGENFLVDAEGRLRGIDKEQALSFLDKKETEHMSYTYSPNPNKTLYNTIFEMYAHREIDLDLEAVKPYIDAVMAMEPDDYRAIFADVVEQRAKGDPVEMQKMSDKILARRDGLQAEYERFFGELAQERGERQLTGDDGKFKFKAPEQVREEHTGTSARRKISLKERGVELNRTAAKTKVAERTVQKTEVQRGPLE